MEFNDIKAEFEKWRHHPNLYRETELLARAQALDFLHFSITVAPDLNEAESKVSAFVADATRLAQELTALNNKLFQSVREAIAEGDLRGAALRSYFDRYTSVPGDATYASGLPINNDGVHTSYGALDVLIDGIFELSNAPAPTITPSAEMVHCEETPALAILDLADQLNWGPTDCFYDLGCGLGQVVMLIHLLCGVPAHGVEIEPAFVDFSRRQAETLDLHDVCFINADAQSVEMRDGTIFFLFTPFRGAMLRKVLTRLHAIAHHHPIRVFTFGPCTPLIAPEPWLRQRSDEIPHEYKLTCFDSFVL